MPRPTLSHDDYTVAWLCPTPADLAQATLMLDERHADLPKPRNDPGAYVLGSIADLNVVLYCLPFGRSGDRVSSNITIWMLSTFRSVKFGLVVGTAGGAPHKVHLGDVVVSSNATPCAVGPTMWRPSASTCYPPHTLLTAFTKFMSTLPPNTPAERYLPRIAVTRPDHLVQNAGFEYPVDVVFPRGIPHSLENEVFVPGSIPRPCQRCDTSPEAGVIVRQPRGINIHFGSIATLDTPLMQGTMRDSVTQYVGSHIDCFDTDTVGVMDCLPCLAIRGISCYADEHGPNFAPVWGEYAGAAAAALAKKLLYGSQSKELASSNTPIGDDNGLLGQDRDTRELATARDLTALSDSRPETLLGDQTPQSDGRSGEGTSPRSVVGSPETLQSMEAPPVSGTNHGPSPNHEDALESVHIQQTMVPSDSEASHNTKGPSDLAAPQQNGAPSEAGASHQTMAPSDAPLLQQSTAPTETKATGKAVTNGDDRIVDTSDNNSNVSTPPSTSSTELSGPTTPGPSHTIAFDTSNGEVSFVPLSGIEPDQEAEWIEIGTYLDHPYGSEFHRHMVSRRETGTSAWFLDSAPVQKWIKGQGQTLFCPGAPGTGKSVLASVVVDKLSACEDSNLDTAVACLYDIHQCPLESTSDCLLGHILAQLVFTSYANPKVGKGPVSRPPDSVLVRVSDIFIHLKHCASRFEKVFVILDGLEPSTCRECRGGSKRVLAALALLQGYGDLTLLVTSRTQDESFVRDSLHPKSFSKEFLDLFGRETISMIHNTSREKYARLEIHAKKEDVDLVVGRACKNQNGNFQQEIKNSIWESCAGVFLVAQLCCFALRTQHSMSKKNIKKQLDWFKEQRLEAADYGTQVHALDRIYVHILQQMPETTVLTETARFARAVLRLFTACDSPIHLASFQEVWSAKQENKSLPPIEDVLSLCGGLVELNTKAGDASDRQLRLVHHTCREFLLWSRDFSGQRVRLSSLLLLNQDR